MIALDELYSILDTERQWSIAVSGGVDSMTLATVAHRYLLTPPLMFHAVSPAVPSHARLLLEKHARAENWHLNIIDSHEFESEDYRSNPVNRCYYCKSHLYREIVLAIAKDDRAAAIASGTNEDDLADFRPGLEAARTHRVRHPFVEAHMRKAEIREIARSLKLSFSEMPAQPCLSSRIETGTRIEPATLLFIDELEAKLVELIASPANLRVRVRRHGVAIETDCNAAIWPQLNELGRNSSARAGHAFLGVEPYRRGSAFLKEPR